MMSPYPINLSQSASTPTNMGTENNFVDYMNLYVKNLDTSVTNTDLFNLFRVFGRIVSARVMSNPHNGLSKGYGFVSYALPEEAHMALEEMNGYIFRSKPMLVAYHAPKKPRQEKSVSSTTSSFQSPITPLDYATYFEPRHPHQTEPITGIEEVDHISMNMKDLTVSEMPRKLSTMAVVETSYSTRPVFQQRPSLASLASGASIQRAPPAYVSKRRNSSESVMTESSAHIQRQRMTEAVNQCGSFSNTTDIVDMLLTLKRKDRSLCLFNPDFLNNKINAALEALDIFHEEEEEEKKKEIIKRRALVPLAPKPTPTQPLKQKEVEDMLSSFEGKALHEQKQLLGDQLFPLVKATGVKQAPRVTIRLLDTIKLKTLANIMFDKSQLKEHVDKVCAGL